jgi:hypothetical protein
MREWRSLYTWFMVQIHDTILLEPFSSGRCASDLTDLLHKARAALYRLPKIGKQFDP